MDERERDILRRAGYGAGPHPPLEHVTVFQVEEELERVMRETRASIIISDIFKFPMGFDHETGNILANPTLLAADLDRFPEVPWREHLRRSVDHELAHKNQWDFLRRYGVPPEEAEELHYHWLRELQALNVAPFPHVVPEVWRREFLGAVERGVALEIPAVFLTSIATSLTREEIGKAPEPYRAVLLELKELSTKVLTKEDIVRYAPRAKELERLLRTIERTRGGPSGNDGLERIK